MKSAVNILSIVNGWPIEAFLKPLNTVVLWCLRSYFAPFAKKKNWHGIKLHWMNYIELCCQETSASRPAVRLIAQVFPVWVPTRKCSSNICCPRDAVSRTANVGTTFSRRNYELCRCIATYFFSYFYDLKICNQKQIAANNYNSYLK